MWKFTELADWWSQQQKESEAILDKWVEDSNYSQGAMIVGAGTKALMTFGAGFVDVLRLGDGLAKGTAAGAGQDGLRLIAILPIGKAAQMVRSVKGAIMARLIVDINPNAGICAWVASAKALTQIGAKVDGKLFVTVEDLAKAAGLDIGALGGLSMQGMEKILTQLGARCGAIRLVKVEQDVARMVGHDGSVVMVIVEFERFGSTNYHAFYAYRTAIGQLRYMDRSVQAATTKIYQGIAEIAKVYGTPAMKPIQAMKIENMFVKTVAHELPRLVLPVLGVVASEDRR
ncbi:hypothetical protein AB4037_30305 [Labrys sp. KB_33_2]|uniref:hypothetical protein n=1 Tax=Labrys sp. KB_33_2 TaxID=3237479 RepID=UPI003F8E79B5